MKAKDLNYKIVISVFVVVGLVFLTQCNDKKKDAVVTLSTEFGDMIILLYDETPKHKKNFLKLAYEGFYDSTTFHRVIRNFMIQGGDPNTKTGKGQAGTGNIGYTLPAEFHAKFTHKKGALAAARQPDRVNPNRRSSGSQFYIVHSEKGCQHLNGEYTVFGEVVKGLAIIDKIAQQPTQRRGMPQKAIRMRMKVELLKKKKITELYGFEYPETKKTQKN